MKDNNDTGMFFGEIEKPTMQSMVDKDIFKKVIVYDFQGLCKRLKEKKNPNAGRSLMTVSGVKRSESC